jgi:hypothetical protein
MPLKLRFLLPFLRGMKTGSVGLLGALLILTLLLSSCGTTQDSSESRPSAAEELKSAVSLRDSIKSLAF